MKKSTRLDQGPREDPKRTFPLMGTIKNVTDHAIPENPQVRTENQVLSHCRWQGCADPSLRDTLSSIIRVAMATGSLRLQVTDLLCVK